MTASPSRSTDAFAVPAGRVARGRLVVPPSKSLTNRYLNLALLAGAPATIERPLEAEDTAAFLAALAACGFEVEKERGRVAAHPGTAACRRARSTAAPPERCCGSSPRRWPPYPATGASTARRGCASGRSGRWSKRLRALGARIHCGEREGYAPLEIEGGTLGGGETILDAGASSQFLSALLMAALRAPARGERGGYGAHLRALPGSDAGRHRALRRPRGEAGRRGPASRHFRRPPVAARAPAACVSRATSPPPATRLRRRR